MVVRCEKCNQLHGQNVKWKTKSERKHNLIQQTTDRPSSNKKTLGS